MAATNPSASERPAQPKSGRAEAVVRRKKAVPRTAARKSAASAPGQAVPRAKAVDAGTNRGATRASTVPVGGRRKPTIDTYEFASRLTSLLAEFPTLYAIWNTPELDPVFREELMVAVARQNDAPYCHWAHRTWAKSVGASKAELARIEHLTPRGLDRRKWAAMAYVRALAATDFEGVPRALRHEMKAHYTPREIRDIELVARVIDLTNRTTNTYEAMLSRLQGKPNAESQVLDEMVLSAVFLTIAPPLVLLLSRYSKRSFLDTARSLFEHVQRFYAQEVR